ncbi:MAG: polysaccharide deacetylase family protein [Thermodesulfobacteriota bacterium]|nr:polysaccharide deacetylase family protein [Thermodesulfobacteriota bacterium]
MIRIIKEAPVLLYHNVGNYPERLKEDGILPETFRQQMKFFSQNNYNIVTLNQALDHLAGRGNLPLKSLALTIDGGYRDAYTDVFHVLKNHNFHATFFIIPECIGRERKIKGMPVPCLSWNEVNEIAESGMEIGLLAYEGRGIKGRYDEKSVKQSIFNSLKIMKENYNGDVRFCAFLAGVPEKPLWHFLKSLGFQAVFTQCPTNQRPCPSGIGRIQIDDDDHNIFLTKISKIYLFFKDKRIWKYIRKYDVDKLAHRMSEALDRIKGNQ